MSEVNDIVENYKIGLPIFEKLFNLKRDKLIEVLKDICSEHKRAMENLENNPSVNKESRNDEPYSLKIYNWSTIEIGAMGIYFKPEHEPGDYIVRFNKFFKLDI